MTPDESPEETGTPFPPDIIAETAACHSVSEGELSNAVATIYLDLMDGGDAIYTHYVSETDDDSLSPISTEDGLFDVIFVEPPMWDQMADRLDMSDEMRAATKDAHERYTRRVSLDERSFSGREPLVMPGNTLSGLTRAGLSRRQAEVQVLRMAGNTQEEIGQELGMDTGTVKSHCHRIDQKVRDGEYLLDLLDGQSSETREPGGSQNQTDHETYPMPLFVQLAVSDMDVSTEWYRALGFEVVFSMPVMTHLRYRKYADLMLVGDQASSDSDHSREETPRGHGVAIYVTTADESVDAVAERADTSGAEISDGPHETSWNTREVMLVDPDGYEVVFSERAETDVAFEDVMGMFSRDE